MLKWLRIIVLKPREDSQIRYKQKSKKETKTRYHCQNRKIQRGNKLTKHKIGH